MILVVPGAPHAGLRPEDVRMEQVRLDREPCRPVSEHGANARGEPVDAVDVVKDVDRVREVDSQVGYFGGKVEQLVGHVVVRVSVDRVDDHLRVDVDAEKLDVGMLRRERAEERARPAADFEHESVGPDVRDELICNQVAPTPVQVPGTQALVFRRREVEMRLQASPLRIPRPRAPGNDRA